MPSGDVTIRAGDIHRVLEDIHEQLEGIAQVAEKIEPGVILFPGSGGPVGIPPPPPLSGNCFRDESAPPPSPENPLTTEDLHRSMAAIAGVVRYLADLVGSVPRDMVISPPTDQPKPIPWPPPPRSHMCLMREGPTTS